MGNETRPTSPAPAGGSPGLSPEEKGNLKKAAIFFAAAIAVILGLKFLLGY